ncbi:MAG: NAD(P)-dependent oxidoreductase [Alphaproteobacteria bacterium]|jgi:phosphoglycerate dehydrogenase-like enzyme
MPKPTLVVAIEATEERRQIIGDVIRDDAEIVFLRDLEVNAQRKAVSSATAIFASRPSDLPDDGSGINKDCRLLQFYSSGVDFLPLKQFPNDLPIAGNGGAFAEPMAEHGLAMALAAGKRLSFEASKMREGEFNQFSRNKMFLGGTAGIVGYGGIGVAMARLFKGIGMQTIAVNRRGASDQAGYLDWIGQIDRLDELLKKSDVVVLSLPLTKETENLINASRLAAMKSDAILVNLARGEIINETALYEHLKANLDFTACIDAWWIEPIRHGKFSMKHPFLDLPNVIPSPHNSASVGVWRKNVVQRAVENCLRAIKGEMPLHLVKPEERML